MKKVEKKEGTVVFFVGLSMIYWAINDDFIKEIIVKNSISGNWGWKEPRTTLFLDFWSHLLPNAKFILIYRSPWEVVDSLYTWQDKIFQTKPELAVKFWLNYNQKIIDFYNYAANRCLLANIQTIINNQIVIGITDFEFEKLVGNAQKLE
ncbi:MAG: sulfotransferase [Trichodesmium sp. MAG_R04]|nr:sulfotransferase [Trichodesmium sp. MAG_R04]